MSKSKTTNHANHYANGRAPEQARILHGVYGDLKVVDAKENLRVFVNSEDISGAKRNNICECVYARACRRLFGSRAVVFFRSIAYVDLPNENGKREVNRFTLGEAVQKRIIEFDKTGQAHPGGFILTKPPKGRTLEQQRLKGSRHRNQQDKEEKLKKQRQYKETYRRRRRAIIVGEITPKEFYEQEGYIAHKQIEGPVGYVRQGSGMAQFITKEKKKTK